MFPPRRIKGVRLLAVELDSESGDPESGGEKQYRFALGDDEFVVPASELYQTVPEEPDPGDECDITVDGWYAAEARLP